jgi:nicotinate-nucleotide pyrophosphorylase (carboxylating)
MILDTRKTAPGIRSLDKYAVRCGGGMNHRLGLFDAILVKDNHVAIVGSLREAVERAVTAAPTGIAVEVEVESLEEAAIALDAGARHLLLDNMPPEAMHEVVELTAGSAYLEASGGITLTSVRAVAETGVDAISSGALTHSVRSLDVSLDISQ